ncbi:putative S-adenosylmethionine-dependent methyltransferase [Streptomyces sp. YIM 121038]|uniref:class I SAM-dependent methyltransferase n=1 Tax=Streptomyces sp. YIM 121038 TaxID=2136401 RepID=UPI0011624373|nr:class I SAM-dependent methyltransferase [Streptomyces sp. YIM 121038]QCX81820.1 putative S-adenosylmethionine-dependent methyltransferase [Streptomyces sp. YIM 121038]
MTAETAYHGEMGEQFAAQATDSAYNAHTERPAMRELAGEVRGLRVLDLGCGAGHLAAEFLERGAGAVTGAEGSASLLAAARERLGDRAALHRHDLEEPLTFLRDGTFDLAVMALVYHHVEARGQLLAEIRRVLRPGGTLLVSTSHPTSDWARRAESHPRGPEGRSAPVRQDPPPAAVPGRQAASPVMPRGRRGATATRPGGRRPRRPRRACPAGRARRHH